jgi:hypothetical protein
MTVPGTSEVTGFDRVYRQHLLPITRLASCWCARRRWPRTWPTTLAPPAPEMQHVGLHRDGSLHHYLTRPESDYPGV